MLVFLSAGVVFVFFARQTGYKMLEKQAEARARGIAKLTNETLERIMLGGKQHQLQEILDATVYSHLATDVVIIDKDGSVSRSVRSRLDSESLLSAQLREMKGQSDWHFSVMEKDSSYEWFLMPIVKKQECYRCHTAPDATAGLLAVKVSIDELRSASVEHQAMNISIIALALIALGGAIFAAVLLLVLRPVNKMRTQIMKVENQVQKMEQGEQVAFSRIEMRQSRDEIAHLVASFNSLIQRLGETYQHLLHLHQRELEQANRLASAGEMAASIAHEIRNPLAGVLGALQVIEEGLADKDPSKEVVGEMIVQLERMNQTLSDLLSYARPTLPVFEQINLNAIIIRTLSLLASRGNQKNVRIYRHLDLSLPPIGADQKLLQQLFWNIILNAIQAEDSGGDVTVMTSLNNGLDPSSSSGSTENGHVRIQVQDTGKGISPENLTRVFNPFFTTKEQGTGFGLAISKRIVDQHNGRISIESEVGKGTSIIVRLPISAKGAG
jgi:signal transduction histidine kinase